MKAIRWPLVATGRRWWGLKFGRGMAAAWVGLAAALVGVLLGAWSPAVMAQGQGQGSAWPTRPIRFVVPFAAGSATDQIARAFGQKAAETLGATIVIENRPGANGMLGAAEVAKAAPDGHTFLIGTNSTNAALKSLVKSLPYDQDTAFAPVAYLGQVPLIVAVNNDVPVRTLRELVELARGKPPGHITFASASTSQLVSSEMLASMSGIKMTNIPFKSGPDAMTNLIGGQVMMFTADFAVTVPQVRAGKIRGLAVTSTARSAAVPDIPTVNEALGLKDYELIAYFAAFAPAGTSPEIIARLNSALNAAAGTRDLQERFANIGFITEPGPPAALAERTRVETAKWARVIREARIEIQ